VNAAEERTEPVCFVLLGLFSICVCYFFVWVHAMRGGAEARRRGKAVELQLLHRLRRLGWSVLRAPGSGARYSAPVPDIVALKRGQALVFEVKLRNKPRSIYIEETKYLGVKEYAENAGARAYLAVKIKGEQDFRVVPWYRAERVELRNGVWYVFYKEKLDRAISLSQLLKEISGEQD